MFPVDSFSAAAGSHVASSSSIGKTDPLAAIRNTPADRKLRKAAGEFESLLLSNLWKSMKTSFTQDDDSDSQDPAHDTLDDMGIQAMSSAVGKTGGLGLGKLILKHLEPELTRSQNGNQAPADKALPPLADIPL